eukprot:3475149-Alexandrium_andersonii.AAC.1
MLALLIGIQNRVGVCNARRGLDDLRAQRRRRDLGRGRCNCGLSAPRAFGPPMHNGTDEHGPGQEEHPCCKGATTESKVWHFK